MNLGGAFDAAAAVPLPKSALDPLHCEPQQLRRRENKELSGAPEAPVSTHIPQPEAKAMPFVFGARSSDPGAAPPAAPAPSSFMFADLPRAADSEAFVFGAVAPPEPPKFIFGAGKRAEGVTRGGEAPSSLLSSLNLLN